MPGRISLKRHLGQLYALMRARDAQRKLVLLYHSVGGGAEATPTQIFRDHIGVIAAMGQLLPLRDVFASTPDRGLSVAITFDDGYATLRDHACAILADFGCAATAFLNVSEIADKERRPSNTERGYYPGEQFLTWRDVDALRVAGWHIGSHGVGHIDLTRADRATIENELSSSKIVIEQRLSLVCDMFAYPWGRNSPALRAAVHAADYRYGFAVHYSGVTSKSDPLAVPRINIAKEYSRDDLAAILRGDWDYLYWLSKTKAAFN